MIVLEEMNDISDGTMEYPNMLIMNPRVNGFNLFISTKKEEFARASARVFPPYKRPIIERYLLLCLFPSEFPCWGRWKEQNQPLSSEAISLSLVSKARSTENIAH